jgi:hypothetical protein
MWRRAVGVVVALSIGFFLYRAALVAVPIGQYETMPSLTCPEGTVPRARFDLLTGLPSGVIAGCPDRDGVVALIWGPIEADILGGHWLRSLLLGLAGAALALTVAWIGWRGGSGAAGRRADAQRSFSLSAEVTPPSR